MQYIRFSIDSSRSIGLTAMRAVATRTATRDRKANQATALSATSASRLKVADRARAAASDGPQIAIHPLNNSGCKGAADLSVLISFCTMSARLGARAIRITTTSSYQKLCRSSAQKRSAAPSVQKATRRMPATGHFLCGRVRGLPSSHRTRGSTVESARAAELVVIAASWLLGSTTAQDRKPSRSWRTGSTPQGLMLARSDYGRHVRTRSARSIGVRRQLFCPRAAWPTPQARPLHQVFIDSRSRKVAQYIHDLERIGKVIRS